jgi:hypothetical protein
VLLCPHQGAPVPPPPVGFCADLPVMPVLAAIWMSQVGRLLRFRRGHVNDRNRRISPVPVRPGEGPLTEPRAGVRPGHRELVFMPHSGRWFAVNPDARAGGVRTFRCERRCRHHSARVLFQRVHCEALSFIQINSPACRRSRLCSPLQTGEIQENLSLYMRTFGKYLAISGNIECHFPLSDRRLRRANRRMT